MKVADLEHWLLVYVATVIGESSDMLSLDMPIDEYDFDSIDAVNMALELEQKLGTPVDPELFLDGKSTLRNVVASMSDAT